MKRALIFDLDNTIYPVSSIAENLFNNLFALIDKNTENLLIPNITEAKGQLTRRPWHLVADEYNFNDKLKTEGANLLKEITYDLPMQPFDDYRHLKYAPFSKFLVTTGFSKLQWSKVKMLGIENDFNEIHIVDPEVSAQTKKDVFADIMKRHGYSVAEVLVIGDDPGSEIKAAAELGIETFLFDPDDNHQNAVTTYRAKSLREVISILEN